MAGTGTLSTLTASLPSFPTSAEVADNLRQAVAGLKTLATNFNSGGLTQTYLEAIAIALGSDSSTLANSTVQGAYEILNTVMRAAYIATASGTFLDLKCADVGIYRKTATSSATTVIFESANPAPASGIVIPLGSVVFSEPADPTQMPVPFVTLAATTIPGSTTSAPSYTSPAVEVQAVNAGSAGNVPAMAITSVQSTVASLTCYNPNPSVGGADQEGDDTPNGGLRARGLAAIANASQSTLAALAAAALTYPGITSAACADNMILNASGAAVFTRGNVLIYCDDGTGNLGSTADTNHPSLAAFNADLTAGKWKAAGVTAVAIGSLLLPVTMSLSIDVSAAYTLLGNTTASVVAAVQAALFGYVNGLALGAPVKLAAVIETAAAVTGVSNVIVPSVVVNGLAADLIPLPQQVPRCVVGPASDITIPTPTVTSYA